MAKPNEITNEDGTAPVGETKREKFVRIAQRRTEKALSAISNLGGLTSTANYEYTTEDWAKIFGALESELVKLQNRVKNPTTVVEGGFTL